MGQDVKLIPVRNWLPAVLAFWLSSSFPTTAHATMDFLDVTAAAGITHSFVYLPEDDTRLGESAWYTGGVVAEDFNGDGWTDLYVLQAGSGPNLLYINQRDKSFEDEAAARGADLVGAFSGCAAADRPASRARRHRKRGAPGPGGADAAPDASARAD